MVTQIDQVAKLYVSKEFEKAYLLSSHCIKNSKDPLVYCMHYRILAELSISTDQVLKETSHLPFEMTDIVLVPILLLYHKHCLLNEAKTLVTKWLSNCAEKTVWYEQVISIYCLLILPKLNETELAVELIKKDAFLKDKQQMLMQLEQEAKVVSKENPVATLKNICKFKWIYLVILVQILWIKRIRRWIRQWIFFM